MSGLNRLHGAGAAMVADLPLCGFYDAFVAELKSIPGFYSMDYDLMEIPTLFPFHPEYELRGSWWHFSAFGGFGFYEPVHGKARFNHGRRASRRKFQ